MTKAFTLMEILIAVFVMFIVGVGLLSASSSSGKLISRAKAKNVANIEFSLAVLNGFCKDSDTNLYEVAKTKFDIKDDKLITALKERSFTCESEEALSMKLADNTELNETLDNIPPLGFIIDKIKANINGTNVIGYEIKAQL